MEEAKDDSTFICNLRYLDHMKIADEEQSHSQAYKKFEQLIKDSRKEKKGEFMDNFSEFTQNYFLDR